jgi:hypothetical protein
MEPYSSLAPASPDALPARPGDEAGFMRDWTAKSRSDISRNHEVSLRRTGLLSKTAVCYDIIYAPLETMWLRHARWSGLRTLNGRGMNVIQAAEALCGFVCRPWLAEQGRDTRQTFEAVFHAMSEVWGR